MKKLTFMVFTFTLIVLTFALPVMAQTEGARTEGPNWLIITGGFAMAIAAGACGIAQSRALAAGCAGVSRNPGASDTIRIFIFLGLAFIEFLALLTFVVILIFKFVK